MAHSATISPSVPTVPYVEPELLVATCTPEGAFVYRNAPWKQVLGGGGDPWQRLAGEDPTLVADAIRQAAGGVLVTNQLCAVRHTVRHTDRDEPLPVLLSFLPVHLPTDESASAGGARQVRAVTITGEVLAEPSSWTPSQTQRHRLEALGRMTMGIAHDFNNLLSALLGHAELIKNEAEHRQLPASVRESIDTIEQVAIDGASLIEKIQRFVRQETQTHFEPVMLPTVIRDCITITRPYWYNEPRRQGIHIDVDTNLDKVPPVMGSAGELREIFVNLILNAVQAMPEGGRLTFTVDLHAREGVRVQIEDTGVGMSEEVRAHIFEPLYTTKGRSGTGMGLTVSYGIVQEHEGAIRVTSAPGHGTRFTLTFPPAEDVPVPEEAPVEVRSPQPARVLVVDDEQKVRAVLTKLLAFKGHTVAQAASGAEALALLENASFDIVFTDYGMPAMNGHQLASALRRRLPALPVVLLSGNTEVTATDDVNALLGKPFKLSELETAIQQLVR